MGGRTHHRCGSQLRRSPAHSTAVCNGAIQRKQGGLTAECGLHWVRPVTEQPQGPHRRVSGSRGRVEGCHHRWCSPQTEEFLDTPFFSELRKGGGGVPLKSNRLFLIFTRSGRKQWGPERSSRKAGAERLPDRVRALRSREAGGATGYRSHPSSSRERSAHPFTPSRWHIFSCTIARLFVSVSSSFFSSCSLHSKFQGMCCAAQYAVSLS